MSPSSPIILLCSSTAPIPAETPLGYVLKWSDEFDGTELDQTKWIYWQPGKRRQATSAPEAVTLKDGFLTTFTWTEGGNTSPA